MKWAWLVLVSTLAFGQSVELLRPTVDTDGGSSVAIALDPTDCTGAAYGGSISLPNWYDSGGLSTSTIFNLNNNSTTQTRCADRVFKTWATSSQGGYTALTLNVNTSGACTSNCGQGTLAYSINGGSTWTQIRQSNGWAQTTDTITLSASQDLTKLQVAVNDFAFNNVPSGAGQGNMAVTGWDIWTAGTFTAATPTPTPAAPPPIKAKHPTVISWLVDELKRMGFVINFDNLEITQEVNPEDAIAFDSEAIRQIAHTEYGNWLVECRLTNLDSYIAPQCLSSHNMESYGWPQITSHANAQGISRNHRSSGPGIHNQIKRFPIDLYGDQHQTVSLLEGQFCLPKRRGYEEEQQQSCVFHSP